MQSRLALAALLALFAAAPPACPAQTNLLWDGGFDTGYGNTFWGATHGGLGPNRRAMWKEGVLLLNQPVASRLYWLEEGTYSLAAWVRRAGADTNEPAVTLELTNNNDGENPLHDTFSRAFPVPADGAWHRVGWSFEIANPARPMFHVLLKSRQPGVAVDAVSLTRGPALPDAPLPAAAIETSFHVPEESGFYVDGESRTVELVIANHGSATNTPVTWEIYDHRETLVRRETLTETWPASNAVRRALPVADLPHDGYRFASSVQGQPVVGDGLAAFLPAFRQDPGFLCGGDASITPGAVDFTAPVMRRLGMNMATLLSPAGVLDRWHLVETAPGKYLWHDETVDKARAEGLELIAFLGMKYPPQWHRATGVPKGKDIVILDEKGYTEAYCRYLEAFVGHYAGRINVFHLEDEIHTSFETPEGQAQLARLLKTARAAAARAAGGKPVAAGVNGSLTDWWSGFIDAAGTGAIDFVSQNTNLRPQWTADTLNLMRAKKCYPARYYTIGVGQKSVLRRTSLIQDRAIGAGAPMGLFAWQLMMGAWLNRPYGATKPEDGPAVCYGYYDYRVLGQCIFQPNYGKTGFEFNNSPTLGLQAMALMKGHLHGLRPARDPAAPYSLPGRPAGHERLMAYPFRNTNDAAIVITTVDGLGFHDAWNLAGSNLAAFHPVNLYGHSLPVSNGVVRAVELPVILPRMPAASLGAALAACAALKSEPIATPEQQRLEVGPFSVDLDPDRPGLLQLSILRDGQRTLVLDGFAGDPALERPVITVTRGRLDAKASITFSKYFILGISVTENGVTFEWGHRNAITRPVTQAVRFRVAQEGAGRAIVIQEGAAVRAGRLREDYGFLFPAETVPVLPPLPPEAARVSIAGFAGFDLPAPARHGASPETGFRWKQKDGQAFLELPYVLQPFEGGGSRGAQWIRCSLTVQTP